MAIDSGLISSKGFNLKFKNYLRDFYVYQFKEKGSDFKAKGIKKDINDDENSNIDKDIIDSIFNEDAKRLQFALKQASGVIWNKGEFVDLNNGRINPNKKNPRVEYITIDSQSIENNPFFKLYQLCSESTYALGTHYSFICLLLMYFHLGTKTELVNSSPLKDEDYSYLNDYLLTWAVDLFSSSLRNNKATKWSDLTENQKQQYSQKVIDEYYSDPTKYNRIMGNNINKEKLERVHNYIIYNKKKIVYDDGLFKLVVDDSKFVEKNLLFKIMQKYGLQVDKKQFGNKMQELARIGIIKLKKRGQRIYYALSDAFLPDLVGNDQDLSVRFSDCISFFAQTSALGEIGFYIQNRLPQKNVTPIHFKHNYIKNTLNDYNNVDLLYAIKKNLCTIIEYRNASINDLKYQRIICYPIEIREHVTNGRQYLLYYHPIFRSVSAVRIEFIDSITIGELPIGKHFGADMIRARALINHTWGTSFDDFRLGNVKTPFEANHIRLIVQVNEKEEFIIARLQREIRNCASLNEFDGDEYGHCFEVVGEVANPFEMLQWLRSYVKRVVLVEINGKEYKEFTDDVIRTYESYIEPTSKPTHNISSNADKSLLFDEIPPNFKPTDALNDLLFNEFFGILFKSLGGILFDIIKEGTISNDRISDFEKKYIDDFIFKQFSKTNQEHINIKRQNQVDSFIFDFVTYADDKVQSIFSFVDECTADCFFDLIPLTSLEIQWLINILSNPLAECFLSHSEIARMKKILGDIDIFDVNSVVLQDQHQGLAEFYDKPGFGEPLQRIMRAIRENRMVKINYKSQYGKQYESICSPAYIEYSKRDNCFRIRAVSKSGVVKTFNLERIIDVSITDDTYKRDTVEEIIKKHFEENERELVIFFNETRNVPDRILTEFSCFKKKCVKWGNERYRMTLYYDKEDTREILVRLLSYGSLINVFDDTGDVRHELIERLENQLELTNSMDLVFAAEPKEKE